MLLLVVVVTLLSRGRNKQPQVAACDETARVKQLTIGSKSSWQRVHQRLHDNVQRQKWAADNNATTNQ
jgi:hypothetical protein